MKTLTTISAVLFALSFQQLHAEPVTTALIALGSIAGLSGGAALALGAIKVASLAYTAFNTYSAYRQGQKAASAAKRAEMEARERNARRNFRASVVPKRIVYGRERLGGAYLFAHNPNSKEAIIVISLADHEIEEVEQVFLMDEELVSDDPLLGTVTGRYADNIKYWIFKGTETQNVGEKLIEIGATNVTMDDKFLGTACIVVQTEDLLKDFPDIDFNISAIFKGKNDIYDPRTGLTGWTDNAALCAADYAETYMNFNRDRINQDELSASANVCDEIVTRKDNSSEKRYTCNGVITGDTEHRAVLPDMALAMAGNIAFSAGQWHFVAGRKSIPSETFTEDDILGEFEYVYKGSAKDIPNVGKGTFKSPDHNWQSVSIPDYIDEERLALANNQRNELDVALPLTNSGTMAQRILKIVVKRAQQEESCSLQLKPSALAVKTTDTAFFSIPRHGIDNEVYEIRDFSTRYTIEKNRTRYDCTASIIKYDETIFDYDALTEEKDILNASVTLGNVSSDAPTEILLTSNAQDYTITWIDPDPSGKDLEHIDLEYCYILTAVEYCVDIEIGEGDETVTFTLPDGASYASSRIRARFDDNTTSGYVTI